MGSVALVVLGRRFLDRRENLIGCWGVTFVAIELEKQPFADSRLFGLWVLFRIEASAKVRAVSHIVITIDFSQDTALRQ